MERKELGRIKKLTVGLGGYQDIMFGVSIELGSDGSGVNDFKGFWSPSQMKRSEHAKWSEADRNGQILDAFIWLDQLMTAAKVRDANALVGKPVEITYEGNMLKSWRILTEVL